jgi:hypothetical protein
MKFTTGDRAVLFLAAGLLILAYMSMKRGQNTIGVLWIIGAFGCGVMLYASRGKGRNDNKSGFSLFKPNDKNKNLKK